jgi:hypothetical protein
MAEIPGDSALNSINRNYDLNYRPNETRDFDFVRIPKEENLVCIDTVDFYEFERVYSCTRPELLHLSKKLSFKIYFSQGSSSGETLWTYSLR